MIWHQSVISTGQILMQRLVLQVDAGRSIFQGGSGGRAGLRRLCPPSPHETTRAWDHLHQATLLDPHRVLQVCVP